MKKRVSFLAFLCVILLVVVMAPVKAELKPGAFPSKGHQFSYEHKTEVVFGEEHGKALDPVIERFAWNRYKYLNDSVMFDKKFIKNIKKVRKYHITPSDMGGAGAKLVSDIVTIDGVQIFCTYFDRGKDKLIVVGEGFTNERELMTPYISLFSDDQYDDYDIVLFDFRGQGMRDVKWNDPETWPLNLAQNLFGMDSGLASLGEFEELDVFAVVDSFRDIKPYKQVYGVSLCHSSFIFLKAQALREREGKALFDKIIVDGCWLDIPLLVEKLKKDPKLICSPQYGGWSDKWPFYEPWAQESIVFLAEHLIGLPISTKVSILDYADHIKKTPVLFFHGKNDRLVYSSEFEALWREIATKKKAAIVTSNPHVRNHLKQKEFYKLAAEMFFRLPFEEFRGCLTNVDTFTKKAKEQHWLQGGCSKELEHSNRQGDS